MQLHQDAQHTLSKRFKIKRMLGKGSFGNVYECEEKKTNELYAIKIISKINVKRSKIECLREEATLLLSLDHPNIVKVFQFFQDEKVIFIKMEYVRMGTLGQFMKEREQNKQPFTDEEASLIMTSIFKAVNYIHSLSILHRDIKPENILIYDKNQLDKLKIADFGLGAKLQFRSPTATSKCGTYLFMAPEIMWNYTYTKAVDVWSCAIIMYMLKKGNHPFFEHGMTNDEFREKIKNVVFPELEDANPENSDIKNNKSKAKEDKDSILNKKKRLLAQDLMNRISKISPNQRYTAQDAIKHPWITRNFQDQIPLSLHDSFQGFQISHQISLMIKMFLTLKNMNLKKEICEKMKKNEVFERYERHCEDVNRKDRSVSPLKIRRMSSLNNTLQIRELCELSEMVMSPKKSKEFKQIPETTDLDNPTIIKLNKIFNNLFDKKERQTIGSSVQSTQGLSSNNPSLIYPVEKCFQSKEIPDMTAYRKNVQNQLQNAVRQRHKRKKQRILPLRKKDDYGDVIGTSCESKRYLKVDREKHEMKEKKEDLKPEQINIFKHSLRMQNKVRVRRRTSNNQSIHNLANDNEINMN